MTSRERLLNTLDRKPTDRVPISTYELVGWNSMAFENNEPSYKPLMDEIRERTDCVAWWNPSSDFCQTAPLIHPTKIRSALW